MMVAEVGSCWDTGGLQILWMWKGRGEHNKAGASSAFVCGYQKVEGVNVCLCCLPGCPECLPKADHAHRPKGFTTK